MYCVFVNISEIYNPKGSIHIYSFNQQIFIEHKLMHLALYQLTVRTGQTVNR